MNPHFRNYFHYTGIGDTKRKLAKISDLNLTKSIDEEKAKIYCENFMKEITKINGYLDSAFSTLNPLFRPETVKKEKLNDKINFEDLFKTFPIKRVPFRAVMGISSGADSSLTAELLCEALRIRKKEGFSNKTDQILFVSFEGNDVNKEDSLEGPKFIEYLMKRYSDLPITLIKGELDYKDYKDLIKEIKPLIPKEEYTENIMVYGDLHKPGILNQIAEAYNFLYIDTCNLTEEMLGETTDGSGGHGHLNLLLIPKGMIYRSLDILNVPKEIGRRSLDTCTGHRKIEQYFEEGESIPQQLAFDIIDKAIVMILKGYNIEEITKKTSHKKEFIENLFWRIYLTQSREKIGGTPFTERWNKDLENKEKMDFFLNIYGHEHLENIYRI